MHIRAVSEADIPSLAALAQKVYAETFGEGMTAAELAEAQQTRSESYFHSIMNADTILVAEDGGALVGFIQFGKPTYDTIQTTEADIELNKIYIAKEKQGHGIGNSLMDAMLAHERLQHVENIYLDVYAQNEKALGLYTKYGFETISKIPFTVNGNVLGYDLLMKKSLKKEKKFK